MQQYFDCLCGNGERADASATSEPLIGSKTVDSYYGSTDEKMTYVPSTTRERMSNDQAISAQISSAESLVATIYIAADANKDLLLALDSIVTATGWYHKIIAKYILPAMEQALKAGKKMSPAIKKAYNKAVEEAKKMEEFSGEHQVMTGVFCTVVAIGILWLMWPAIIEALGFSELGPVEGEAVHILAPCAPADSDQARLLLNGSRCMVPGCLSAQYSHTFRGWG